MEAVKLSGQPLLQVAGRFKEDAMRELKGRVVSAGEVVTLSVKIESADLIGELDHEPTPPEVPPVAPSAE